MPPADNTQKILEEVLAKLYSEQAKETNQHGSSYLIAQDGQFLGEINTNWHDRNSILNEYGPYGSPYSKTSIFNSYSSYGSEYGRYSINNPYCSSPPKLFINSKFLGHVSANRYVLNRYSPEAFIYTLRNDINSLLLGKINETDSDVRRSQGESFIEAYDGTFLGKINPNRYDIESIFNEYGPYGNRYSTSSIFNRFSNYGSQFSDLSPYNKYSSNPPKIIHLGRDEAYLTKNEMLSPRIDPDEILKWAQTNVRKYG